jgi:ribosomal RNA-processing protein 9
VVTGGKDKKIVVWDASTLKPLRVFNQHRDAVTGLAFRRGTNQLYSSSKDRTIKVWSLDELAYIETLFGHQDQVVDVAALAQERCISVGARDRTARLWKVVEETQLVFRGGGGEKKSKHGNPLKPQEGSIDRVAMIDEEMFVTGSDNGSLSLWAIHKKKPVFTLSLCHGEDPPMKPEEASAEVNPDPSIVPQPQPRWITALATIPYSDVILSGSWDGSVRVWRVSDDKKKIERVGVVGPSGGHMNGNVDSEKRDIQTSSIVRGVINDISIFERGDRGKDGVCVIVAVGVEHRLGGWLDQVEGKNGSVVFEIPRHKK